MHTSRPAETCFTFLNSETFKYVFVTVMTTFKETIEFIDLSRATSNNKGKNYFKLINLKP